MWRMSPGHAVHSECPFGNDSYDVVRMLVGGMRPALIHPPLSKIVALSPSLSPCSGSTAAPLPCHPSTPKSAQLKTTTVFRRCCFSRGLQGDSDIRPSRRCFRLVLRCWGRCCFWGCAVRPGPLPGRYLPRLACGRGPCLFILMVRGSLP